VSRTARPTLRLINAMTFNTEIIIFDTSNAFRENQEIVTNALKPTLQADDTNM
jgi:hypothetical protein